MGDHEGLIQTAEKIKMTKVQCLSSRSSRSGGGDRRVNSELKDNRADALMEVCVLCALKRIEGNDNSAWNTSRLLKRGAMCRDLKDLDELL